MLLEGRTAIVTGSGRGIGRALALEFARQGASVVCCARTEDEINETVDHVRKDGGTALAIKADITERDQIGKVVGAALKEYGQIDVLFNNAGSFRSIGALWEVDPDAWWRDVEVNLRGPMLCCQAVLPHMISQDEGVIINMNGGGSTSPLAGGSGYGCSKAALIRLTDTLATELAQIGSSVLVFGMGPGLVRTEMTELQVETPEGRKWIPGTGEAFEAGNTRPPEDCARDTVQLLRVACKELSGRIFGVGADFDDIERRAPSIADQDLYQMRFRT